MFMGTIHWSISINALLNKKDCQIKLWGIHYE